MAHSLFTATILDMRTLVDMLLSDESNAAWPSVATLVWLREIRICAHNIAQGAVFPSLARRMDVAAAHLGYTEPSPVSDLALAAHNLAQCILNTGPLTTRQHIFEARVALRNQRAVHVGVSDSPRLLRLPTTHIWDP